MKKLLIVLSSLATIVLMIFAGCSAPMQAPSKDYSGGVTSAPAATAAPTTAPEANGDASNVIDNSKGTALALQANTALAVADQKLIRTGKIELQTKTYNDDFDTITSRILVLGGYIERSSESGTKPTSANPTGRSASIVARIPKASFDSFLSELGKIGEMISRNVDSQDISGEYSDIEGRLKTARTTLETYQSFLAQAKKVDDVIDLQTRISQTEQDIESMSGQLKRYDNQVDYSAIDISLREVVELKNVEPAKKTDDFGTNISNSFYGGLNAIGVFFEAIGIALAASWPFLLLIGVITFLIVWFATSKKRKAKKKGLITPVVQSKEDNKQI